LRPACRRNGKTVSEFGPGADINIIDDPLKPEEALSQAQRQGANDWFDHTRYSRLNDTGTGGSS
jgi:hypothetical protein